MALVKTSSLYQQIYKDIKTKILSGELRPNDPIATQIELAKQYNVSEVTSKRALKELAEEGLVDRFRRKGTFVKDRSEKLPDKIIPASIDLKRIYLVNHPSVKMSTFSHPFFAHLIEGIEEACNEQGVEFEIWDVGPKYQLPDDDEAGFILFTHEIYLETLEKWKKENRRLVNIHISFPHLQIPYIIVDNLTGGYLATQHLLSLKHRRIGIILTGDAKLELNQEFSLRLQGYKLALSQYRIESDPNLVCIITGQEELEEMGYVACSQLLDLKDPPTAIFATSDYKAFGAIRAVQDRGLRVPEDISIIGYDNFLVGQYKHPTLTTINQNTDKLGIRAVKMLLYEWHNDPSKGILKDEIVPTLVIRNSTAEFGQNE